MGMMVEEWGQLFTDFVTTAGDAITILGSRVVVLAAPLAISSVAIVPTIYAVTTVPGRLVKRLVEVAAIRITVAIAS